MCTSKPPEKDKLFIPKSCWATAECYLGSAQYNDVYIPNDPQLYQELRDGGREREGGSEIGREGRRKGRRRKGRRKQWRMGGGRDRRKAESRR